MHIYVAHSGNFDYRKRLYSPIRASHLNEEHTIVFPHDKEEKFIHTKPIIEKSTLVVAEVSYPSTGLGIELGWADAAHIPIICLYTDGSKPSDALRAISAVFAQYQAPKDMVEKITTAIAALSSTM